MYKQSLLNDRASLQAEDDLADKIETEDINNDIDFLMNYISKKEQIDPDTKYLMDYVESLDKLIQAWRHDLSKMKQNEIIRISREYMINDYERRFCINIERIVSLIVGKDNVRSEMKKIINERKKYYFSLKLCRNFNSFESKNEKYYDKIFKNAKGLGIIEN